MVFAYALRANFGKVPESERFLEAIQKSETLRENDKTRAESRKFVQSMALTKPVVTVYTYVSRSRG